MEKDARSHYVFKIKAKSHGLISCAAVLRFQGGSEGGWLCPHEIPPGEEGTFRWRFSLSVRTSAASSASFARALGSCSFGDPLSVVPAPNFANRLVLTVLLRRARNPASQTEIPNWKLTISKRSDFKLNSSGFLRISSNFLDLFRIDKRSFCRWSSLCF